ncbi:hypothetical protein ZWY2020_009453 [Hordeum vulgare]|nr:hypothetical protein ZWY2020_009453 [Hordeum vulgare]
MAAAPAGPRGGEKPPTDVPALEAAKAKSPERQDDGLQKATGAARSHDGRAFGGRHSVAERRRMGSAADGRDESTKVSNQADDGGRFGSPKSENIKNRPSEDAKNTHHKVDHEAPQGGMKPVEEDLQAAGPSHQSGSNGAKRRIMHHSREATLRAGTSRSWSSNLVKAGKVVEESSRYVGSWHAPLQHSSDFLQQVSRYARATGLQHGCPAAFIWLSWACEKVSSFLAEAATTVQGASALARMVGECNSMIGKKLTAEPGEQTEKDGIAKAIITSCEQLEEVLKFWEAGTRVQLDIGPDVSPALANLLYEILRQRGPAALELIKSGENMRAKCSGA